MSEHENGNFVLKCGQNQQKYQSFMAISDFALLYRIRRSCARFRLLSYLKNLLYCHMGLWSYFSQGREIYALRRPCAEQSGLRKFFPGRSRKKS